MSHIRQFEQASVFYGDKWVPGLKVTCGKCPKVATHQRGSTKTNVGPVEEAQRFTKMFTRDGWHIGRRPEDDRCPDCMEKLGVSKPKPPVTQEKKPMVVTAPAKWPDKMVTHAPDPKPMSREDGRLIFAKLEEVYRDEHHGYQDGWSDQKVATDMGVPRAWVEDVRKKFFGPEGGNEEIQKLLTEGKALVTSAEQIRMEAARLAVHADEIGARASSIQTRLDRIEKTVGR